jgi:hypothetical protein
LLRRATRAAEEPAPEKMSDTAIYLDEVKQNISETREWYVVCIYVRISHVYSAFHSANITLILIVPNITLLLLAFSLHRK